MGLKTPRSADLSRAQLSASQQTFLTFRRRRLRSTFTLFWLRGGQNAQTELDSGAVQIPQTRTEAAAERARKRRKVPSTEQSFGDAQSFRRSRPAALPTCPGLSTESDAAPTFASNPSSPRGAHSPCVRARAHACGSELRRVEASRRPFFPTARKKFEWKWLQSEQERHAVVLSLSGC